MRPNFINLALVLFAVIATGLPARAAEISSFKIKDLPKKIQLTFEFTDVASYSTVSDFNSNILVLKYDQLKFSNKQRSRDHRLEGDKDFDVLRFVRFQDTGEQAEIRIYLGWEVSPADAQVIAFDDRIEVDIMKPMRIAAPDDNAGMGSGEWQIERDPDPVDDAEDNGETEAPVADPDAETPDKAEPDEGGGLSLGSLRQPDFPEMETDGAAPDVEASAQSGPGQVDGTAESTADGDGADGTSLQSDFRPAREFTASPSYKKFDLDEVDVNQLEFRSVPFNEALLDLVVGTGFNVVVGEGIDNKEVTLNFTKKKMSLKSALYVLCTAYDLEYTVEDDAIIIRAKR